MVILQLLTGTPTLRMPNDSDLCLEESLHNLEQYKILYACLHWFVGHIH